MWIRPVFEVSRFLSRYHYSFTEDISRFCDGGSLHQTGTQEHLTLEMSESHWPRLY